MLTLKYTWSQAIFATIGKQFKFAVSKKRWTSSGGAIYFLRKIKPSGLVWIRGQIGIITLQGERVSKWLYRTGSSASTNLLHPLWFHPLSNSSSENCWTAHARARQRIASSSSGDSVRAACIASANSCGVCAWNPIWGTNTMSAMNSDRGALSRTAGDWNTYQYFRHWTGR